MRESQSREKLPARPFTSGSQWSSETTILGYVSPERMRWNLEQPQSALIWQLHHGTRPGESLPLDFLSPRDPRPKSRGLMSPLTVLQNEKLETINALTSPKAVVTAPTSPGQYTGFRPSERDYKRLMDRLEKLASRRAVGSVREQLKEGKGTELSLEEGESQVCFVSVRRKVIPLRIKVKRTRGRVVVYSSKTVAEPSESLCDEVHRGENIVIAEPGLRFKIQCVNLCVKALEDATVVLTVAFGREKVDDETLLQRRPLKHQASSSNLDELRLDEGLRLELQEKVGVIMQHRKCQSTQLLQFKDFVELNKRVVSPHSPERLTLLQLRAQNHSQRISTAQSRKREQADIKKQRTLLVINRHKIRMEEEERQLKLREQLEKRQKCEGNWLSLVYFGVAGQQLLTALRDKKELLRNQARRNQAAAFIQATLRRRYNRLSGKELLRLRGLCALKEFAAEVGPLLKLAAATDIVQHMRKSARNNLIQDTFSSFYRRVILIQKMWRAYQQKEKERWRSLIDFWGKTVEGLLAEANRKYPGKKGAKKRQEAMDRYLGVQISHRNAALRNYFKGYKLQYREEVRKYIRNNYHQSAFRVAKAFQYFLSLKRKENTDELLLAPAFRYLPSEDKMRELIESAVSLSMS